MSSWSTFLHNIKFLRKDNLDYGVDACLYALWVKTHKTTYKNIKFFMHIKKYCQNIREFQDGMHVGTNETNDKFTIEKSRAKCASTLENKVLSGFVKPKTKRTTHTCYSVVRKICVLQRYMHIILHLTSHVLQSWITKDFGGNNGQVCHWQRKKLQKAKGKRSKTTMNYHCGKIRLMML